MPKFSLHRQTKKRAKGCTRGTLFREVAKRHLKSANVLLKGGCEHDAIYLGGYAIECMLKYAVARQHESDYLPAEFETHDLDSLLEASGFGTSLRKEAQLHAAYSALADGWGPAVRYQASTLRKGEAERLYNHVVQLYKWITEQIA